MPRQERTTREVVVRRSGNGLTAAAVRLSGPGAIKAKKFKKPPAWYMQAWHYFDCIGEYRYACQWVGNLMSRALLFPTYEGKQTDKSEALEVMGLLFGGPEGQREMLRQLGTHLTVAGDSYIFGEEDGNNPDKWRVVAATSVKNKGTESEPVFEVNGKLLDDPLSIRLWRPHPADYDKSDSPTRAVLNILAEIEAFTQDTMSQLRSRLMRAGILALPTEMTFGSVRSQSPNAEDPDDATLMAQSSNNNIDALLIEILETIMEAIADPDSPAAQSPILLQVPGEFVDKIKHITFWTPFDENSKAMREEAIRRLALGMDMPPEVLTGTAEMNHWNAWQIEEASIKAHTEPLLQIITSSLAESYLRATLVGGGMDPEEARKYSIGVDTSKIRLRPNRSRESQELYSKGELSPRVMLIENGFDPETDAMTVEERKDWLTKNVASGSTTPELVAYALQLLGVPIPADMIVVKETPTEAPQAPSLRDHPDRNIPDETDISRAEVLVFRALERAGARLRSKHKDSIVSGSENVSNAHLYRYARITDGMMDDLLLGAWDVLPDFGVRMSPVILDKYVRHLFSTNERFDTAPYRNFVLQGA